MAWGLNGDAVKGKIRVALSNCKSTAYSLEATVKTLNHEEKKEQLSKMCFELWEHLDRIEKQLNR